MQRAGKRFRRHREDVRQLCAGNTIEAQDAKFDSAEVARRNTGKECQIGQGQSTIASEGSECSSHTGRQCSAWVRIPAPSIHQNIVSVHDNMLTYHATRLMIIEEIICHSPRRRASPRIDEG